MDIKPLTFSQKWDVTISSKEEETHLSTAFYNHMATVATAVTWVALTVFSAVFFSEIIATVLLIGVTIFLPGAIEFARTFLSKAKEARELEMQAQKVRGIYERLISKKALFPEAKALHFYWEQKALEAQKGVEILHKRALEKATDPAISAASLKNYRIEALEGEKEAAKLKIYSLLLKSLVGTQETFEKAFLRYDGNLLKALPELGTWDACDAEQRAVASKFTKKDILFTFSHRKIAPISYGEVVRKNPSSDLKGRLHFALSRTLI